MTKGPVDGISDFVGSMVSDPGYTLKTTFKGVTHIGEMETFDKFSAPFFGLTGIGMTFMGAAFGDPFAIAIGTYGTLRGGGMFFEHGEKISGGKPPGNKAASDAPPPPAPS